MTPREEIEILIRARYPILYIVSPEELRVQSVLQDIGQQRQKRVYEWSVTMGLVPSGTSIQVQKTRNAPSRDPLVALDQVIDQVEPAVFLFKDLHPFLVKSNHAVVRKLREIAQHLKNSHKTIVLISPILELPVELEKEVTLVSFPLPSRQELDQMLEGILRDVQQIASIEVELNDQSRARLLDAALGLTLGEAENVFAKLLVTQQRISEQDVHQVFSEKQQIVRKSGLLEYYPATETLAQVGGLAVLKEWLQKRAIAFTEDARLFGLPAPKGVLLLGVQGCGKSLCAKAVSSAWQLPLLRFDIGRMFGSFVGSSEENIRRAIAVAESVAPAILWVDEIDKAFSGSQSSGATDAGTSARVFGTFLTWLSEKTAPVFVVTTANDISHLPPELMRKGRLDEIFFVDLPSVKEREQVFAIHLAKRNRNPADFHLAALAEASPNFSGAEIEQAIISALYDAFSSRIALSTKQILQAIRQTVPLATTMDDHIERLRRWSEGRARNASGPRNHGPA